MNNLKKSLLQIETAVKLEKLKRPIAYVLTEYITLAMTTKNI